MLMFRLSASDIPLMLLRQYFMETLIDGDLASNNGGWQWSASTGVDPAPYFRIFNPYTQSKKVASIRLCHPRRKLCILTHPCHRLLRLIRRATTSDTLYLSYLKSSGKVCPVSILRASLADPCARCHRRT